MIKLRAQEPTTSGDIQAELQVAVLEPQNPSNTPLPGRAPFLRKASHGPTDGLKRETYLGKAPVGAPGFFPSVVSVLEAPLDPLVLASRAREERRGVSPRCDQKLNSQVGAGPELGLKIVLLVPHTPSHSSPHPPSPA